MIRTLQDALCLEGAICRVVQSLGAKSGILRMDRFGFQDHGHRPLGHPSASKIAPELVQSLMTTAYRNRHVSGDLQRSALGADRRPTAPTAEGVRCVVPLAHPPRGIT